MICNHTIIFTKVHFFCNICSANVKYLIFFIIFGVLAQQYPLYLCFRKIIVTGNRYYSDYNEDGILTVGLYNFLLRKIDLWKQQLICNPI